MTSVKLDPEKPKNPWYARLWKWLEPPSPKDLGKSEYNALPSSLFDHEPGAYTWEDWHKEVSRDYSVRYFITNTLSSHFRHWWRYVEEAVYWVKCHTLPSYRFHVLDLRDPGPGIEYRYGFRDKPNTMLWACFVILRGYIEKEQPQDVAEHFSPEELTEEPLLSQKARYDEAHALYDWWMKGRLEDEAETNKYYEHYKKVRDTPEKRAAGDAWFEAERRKEAKEQEMLLRLVAIREGLWT